MKQKADDPKSDIVFLDELIKRLQEEMSWLDVICEVSVCLFNGGEKLNEYYDADLFESFPKFLEKLPRELIII